MLYQLSYLMLVERSIDANLIVYVDLIVNQVEHQYEVLERRKKFSDISKYKIWVRVAAHIVIHSRQFNAICLTDISAWILWVFNIFP